MSALGLDKIKNVCAAFAAQTGDAVGGSLESKDKQQGRTEKRAWFAPGAAETHCLSNFRIRDETNQQDHSTV